MNKKDIIKILFVFLVSYIVLLSIFVRYGYIYADLFSPLFKAEIGAFFPEFKVYSIGYENFRGQDMISMQVKTTKVIPLGSKQLPIGYPIVPKTHAVNQYMHPVIIFSILLGWPRITWRGRLAMLACALPLLILLECIDIPLVLVANCQQHIYSLHPEQASALVPPLTYWREFLINGGRAVVCIFFAGLAIAGYYLLQAFRTVEPDRNAPCICGSGKKYKQCCMSH
jgi:hypothetical protein